MKAPPSACASSTPNRASGAAAPSSTAPRPAHATSRSPSTSKTSSARCSWNRSRNRVASVEDLHPPDATRRPPLCVAICTGRGSRSGSVTPFVRVSTPSRHARTGRLRPRARRRLGEMPGSCDEGNKQKRPALSERGVQDWPCTPCRSRRSGLSTVAGSGRASPRHPGRSVYGCYLPVLTGFAVPRRAGPFHQHRVSPPVPKRRTSKGSSTPLRRVAGSGHRQLPI